ncbi:hypothetical protein [Terribacillus sp. AE2B 122]|nr:hypothetical protein [Terribacillus sp. AE2B 122]
MLQLELLQQLVSLSSRKYAANTKPPSLNELGGFRLSLLRE